MRYGSSLVICVGLLLLGGCSDDTGGDDAGGDARVDVAAPDGPSADGPSADGPTADGPPTDAAVPDTGAPDSAAVDLPSPDVPQPDLTPPDLGPPSPDIDPYKGSFATYCSNYPTGWGTCISRGNMMCSNTCSAHPAVGIYVPKVECGLSRTTPNQIWCQCCLAGPMGAQQCSTVNYGGSGVTCADCQKAFNDGYCGLNP